MPQPLPPLLIYLHGFNSSPGSHKAQLLQRCLAASGQSNYCLVPRLDSAPETAMQYLEQLLESRVNNANITLLGSSLGGYYASFLAEWFEVRVILVNPAVNPVITLESYLGKNENYHTQESFDFTAEHLKQLEQYAVGEPSCPERFLVFLQTGDETLDYSEAAEKYRCCEVEIELGGSHGYSGFERIIPQILDFAGIPAMTA